MDFQQFDNDPRIILVKEILSRPDPREEKTMKNTHVTPGIERCRTKEEKDVLIQVHSWLSRLCDPSERYVVYLSEEQWAIPTQIPKFKGDRCLIHQKLWDLLYSKI